MAIKHRSAKPCRVSGQSQGHGWCVCPSRRKAHLAQRDGAGSQADEAPFPTVGVLRQGKLLRQGLDHMLDLHGVVLGHELPDQPGERGRGLQDQCNQPTPAAAPGPGLAGGGEMTGLERGVGSRHVRVGLSQGCC